LRTLEPRNVSLPLVQPGGLLDRRDRRLTMARRSENLRQVAKGIRSCVQKIGRLAQLDRFTGEILPALARV